MFQVEDDRFRDGMALTVYAVETNEDEEILFLVWGGKWTWIEARHCKPWGNSIK